MPCHRSLNSHYTIPKIKRELKPYNGRKDYACDYTIPKIKRELKRHKPVFAVRKDYTIPKIKRELKHVTVVDYVVDYYTIPKIKRELNTLMFTFGFLAIIPLFTRHTRNRFPPSRNCRT